MADPKLISGGVCCGVLVIAAIILIVLSFKSLEYTQLGLNYSHLSSSISSTPFANGRHMIGFANSFIKFPSTLVTVAFAPDGGYKPVNSRTADGLDLEVVCSFQYQFSVSTLYDMYNKFGPAYHNVFVNIATEVITSEATHYSAAFWFSNFSSIQYVFQEKMGHVFETTAFADVQNFQLTAVVLPTAFEDEIRQTEVQRQSILTVQSQANKEAIQQETRVVQATRQASAIGIAADAQAQATMLNVRAWIEPYELQQNATAEAFAKLYPEFGSNEEYFLDYLAVRVARDHPEVSAIYSHAEPQ